MTNGSIVPPEMSSLVDSETGVNVRRLTSHLCHSNHFYFAHRSLCGAKMLFHSDRYNAQNLFSIGLDSGEISQVTGYEPSKGGLKSLGACLNPV